MANCRRESTVFRGDANGARSISPWTRPFRHGYFDTAISDIRTVAFTPSSDGDSPVLPELLDRIPEGEEIGTVTPVDAILPSSTTPPSGPSRSARTVDLGKRIASQPGPETKPCAPPGIMVVRSGSAGQDTMPVAGSGLRCAASKPLGNASIKDPDRQTAEIQIRVALVNRFNALGTAEIVRVA
jgi:hypothetical protein